MSKSRNSRAPKQRESTRRPKKKVSVLVQEQVDYIDWKDVNLLRRFMSDRAKIRARRVTGNDAQQQRQVAIAIKNAREMALLPYTSRVTTQRGRRNDDERRPRREEPDAAPEFEELADDEAMAVDEVEGLDEDTGVES
jgi:small subunit ribosomal protein S18